MGQSDNLENLLKMGGEGGTGSCPRAQHEDQLNVLGTKLQICSTAPLTGWFRDGYCTYDRYDPGVHVVCGTMTKNVSNFFGIFVGFVLMLKTIVSFWILLSDKAMTCPLPV